MRFWEHASEPRFLDAAMRCARALADHVRDVGADTQRSPWPFRVDAATGARVVEEYGADVVAPIALFDELGRLGLTDASMTRARAIAWSWLLAVPMTNDAWSNYFEDVVVQPSPDANPTQYIALETARFVLRHPERDAEWRAHAAHLVDWTARVFGADGDPEGGPKYLGMQYGAEAISEQWADRRKMGSHTARFASVLALLYERTGDASLRARAFRSFNWATYLASDTGVVVVNAPPGVEGWFSDGYGDYVRHFLGGLGAVPAWAPASEDHLVGSSSVVRSIAYEGSAIRYATYDAAADDVLRLRAPPASVTVAGSPVAPSSIAIRPVTSGGVVVRIHRQGPIGGEVRIAM